MQINTSMRFSLNAKLLFSRIILVLLLIVFAFPVLNYRVTASQLIKDDNTFLYKKAPDDNSVKITSFEHDNRSALWSLTYYKITGTFSEDNTFTLQLSDKNGSFANPTDLGFKKSNKDGNIPCEIYKSDLIESNYKIRLISSNPSGIISDTIPLIFFRDRARPVPGDAFSRIFQKTTHDYYVVNPLAGFSYVWSINWGKIVGAGDRDSLKVEWDPVEGGLIYGSGSLYIDIANPLNITYSIRGQIQVLGNPSGWLHLKNVDCTEPLANYEIVSDYPLEYFSMKWQADSGTIIGIDTIRELKVKWNVDKNFILSLNLKDYWDSTLTFKLDFNNNLFGKSEILGNDHVCPPDSFVYQHSAVGWRALDWEVIGGAIILKNDSCKV